MQAYWEQIPLHAVALVLQATLVIVAVVHILLFKTNSRSAFGWLAFVVVFPLAGPLIYWLFGINRVWREVLAARPRWSDLSILPPYSAAISERPLLQVGARVSGNALLDGNKVDVLVNGEQAFPEMLAAIDGAEFEVLLSSYIFDRDTSGGLFVKALAGAQGRGVRVCLLLDDVGRHYSFPSIVGDLRRAGVQPKLFMPLKLLPPSLSFNLRNHRKLLVVDCSVGFIGGMNIGDRQLADGESRLRSSDLHFKVVGSVVRELRALFRDDWLQSGGAELNSADCSSSVSLGGSQCRLIVDGPDERLEHLSLVIEGVVSAARRRIVMISPYFLPGTRLIGTLRSAAVRGVEVVVIVPHVSNWPIVRWALNHSVRELLSVGVQVLEQPAPFAHAKCLLIDDDYALVGSANFDARSLRLNFEVGMEVVDPEFNDALSQHAKSIIEKSTEISAQRLSERGVLVRLRDALAGMFAPYL